MNVEQEVIGILTEVLGLDRAKVRLDSASPLLGSIPEFDSMAVVSVLTAIEDRMGLVVDDDEVDAELFATVGALCRFVEEKLGA